MKTPEFLMPLKTRGPYLCMDTRLFNALNKEDIHFIWDYDNKGLKFENNGDFRRAMELKQYTEETIHNQEVITDRPNIISNVPKKEITKPKKSKLF